MVRVGKTDHFDLGPVGVTMSLEGKLVTMDFNNAMVADAYYAEFKAMFKRRSMDSESSNNGKKRGR